MRSPLRVLIVEDNPADVELMILHLTQAGFQIDWQRVETEAGFLAALEAPPGLILSDWSLPRFNGLRALQLLGERGLDIPFIIVSGGIGEDTAMDALRNGADDCVSKHQPARLGHSVRRALEDKQLREARTHTEEALKARNRQLTVLNNVALELSSIDASRDLATYITSTLKKLTGAATATFGLYDSQNKEIRVERVELEQNLVTDLIQLLGGKKLTEARFPVSDDIRRDLIQKPLRIQDTLSEITFGVVPPMVGKIAQKVQGIDRFVGMAYVVDGDLFGTTVLALKAGQPDPSLEMLQSFASLVAVSLKRKQAEDALRQSENKLRALFAAMTDVIIVYDALGRYLEIAPTMPTNHFRPHDKLLGRTISEFLPPDQANFLVDHIQKTLKTGQLTSVEYSLHNGDKDIWFAALVSPLSANSVIWVARDITERKGMEEERQQAIERLRKALGATVQSITAVVEIKDPYTAGHQQNVANLARAIATEMGLNADQIDGIHTAGTIHDIGKISVPAEILSKPTKLTEIEFSLIKRHPRSGHDILKEIDFPWPVARIVLEHHEKMNGSGYPEGLSGDRLLIESRIIAVADVVETMTSHRPYRPALGIDSALDEISKHKGILFDQEVVDACLRLFNENGYKMEGWRF
ncbi:MAG: HD domain-containing phosphohydrolase [Smithellaceae bacterium]|nr:HD domain-containing phosphohydrolase [Smithellaceae bacterium]